jgi:hypothetical protein
VVDIATEKCVPNQYVDREIPPEFIQAARPTRPRLPEDFDAELYLRANPDVEAAGTDAASHYLAFGRTEGRKLRP